MSFRHVLRMIWLAALAAACDRRASPSRTAALDEATGTLYLATGRFTSADRDDPTGRRSAPFPGSFHLTVMAPAP